MIATVRYSIVQKALVLLYYCTVQILMYPQFFFWVLETLGFGERPEASVP